MGGPAASILSPFAMTDERSERLRALVLRNANEVRGDDFWIEGRPFALCFRPDYPEQPDEIVASGLPLLLGWRPSGHVQLNAMCNEHSDHRQLAQMCIEVAEAERGLVDFGGQLFTTPQLDRTVWSEPIRIVNPHGLNGILYATSYETMPGYYATAHYGDATLLRSWFAHPEFRMIK